MEGKEKCDMLKRIREKIAKENGIDGFEYQECVYDGPCHGTCLSCDAETEALYLALSNAGVTSVLEDKDKIKALCDKELIKSAKQHKLTMGASELIPQRIKYTNEDIQMLREEIAEEHLMRKHLEKKLESDGKRKNPRGLLKNLWNNKN